jgi:hypothetical protein
MQRQPELLLVISFSLFSSHKLKMQVEFMGALAAPGQGMDCIRGLRNAGEFDARRSALVAKKTAF